MTWRLYFTRPSELDFYTFSPYKTYGPHMGALFGTTAALASIEGPNHFFVDPTVRPGIYSMSRHPTHSKPLCIILHGII